MKDEYECAEEISAARVSVTLSGCEAACENNCGIVFKALLATHQSGMPDDMTTKNSKLETRWQQWNEKNKEKPCQHPLSLAYPLPKCLCAVFKKSTKAQYQAKVLCYIFDW